MLADAKILIRSAPSALNARTRSRICSVVHFALPIDPIEVRMRGPGSTPRLIASRNGLSEAAPTLCTVVKPFINVTYAFSAP